MRSNSSNRLNIPRSKQGCNGDLGKAQMVNKMRPIGRARSERQSRTAAGHCQRVAYIATMTI